jgi:hypothetical protein
LAALDVRIRPWARALVAFVQSRDPRAQVTSTLRTHEEQLCLLQAAAEGRAGVYRPALHSNHERGLALDISARPDVLDAAHDLWISWGGAGRTSGDPVHFQPIVIG